MLSVQQRFNEASQSYDEVATIQKICARKLSDLIIAQCAPQSLSSILDLGSGTGYMVEALWPYFSKHAFTLTDFAPKMIRAAEQKFQAHPNIRYQCANFVTDFFDFHALTVSNLAFQWAKDLEGVIMKHLHNTDTLAFSCLLSGTFEEWYALLRQNDETYAGMHYPTAASLTAFLKQQCHANLVTTSEDYVLSFPNARSMMQYLKALGASKNDSLLPLSSLKKIIAEDQPFCVTYRVFYGVLQKWS